MNFNATISVIPAGGSEFELLPTANFKDDGDATRHRSSVAISQGNRSSARARSCLRWGSEQAKRPAAGVATATTLTKRRRALGSWTGCG